MRYTQDRTELRFCGCTVFLTEVFEAGIYTSIIFCGSRILTNAVRSRQEPLVESRRPMRHARLEIRRKATSRAAGVYYREEADELIS